MKPLHLLARPKYAYLDVQLCFLGEENADMEVALFKYAVVLALRQLFGEVGSAIPVDVLRYDRERTRAYLRTSVKNVVQLWSSLTLFSSYNGRTCTFRVYKVSLGLASLSVSGGGSRHLVVATSEARR